MSAHTALWIYIVLLVLGGLTGYLKAGSKVSLIASCIFAAVLSLFALDFLPFRYHLIVLLLLLVFFSMRLGKTKRFMPSGVMVILTLLALAAPHLL